MAVSGSVTPEMVKKLEAPTDQFLCKLSDNEFNIKFGAFRIRDMESGITLVDVTDDEIQQDEGDSP